MSIATAEMIRASLEEMLSVSKKWFLLALSGFVQRHRCNRQIYGADGYWRGSEK